MICQGGQEEYIEETHDLRERMRIHRQHIHQPGTTKISVSQHIDQCAQAQPKFKTFPIFKMLSTNVHIIKKERIRIN